MIDNKDINDSVEEKDSDKGDLTPIGEVIDKMFENILKKKA